MRALPPKEELLDGDLGWRGVNMRLHPSQLEAGWAAQAVNMRFTDGKPETRRGKCPLTWMNKITGGVLGPWGTVYGPPKAFLDPVSGQRLLLIAADGNVYYCRSNNPARSIALPGGTTVTTDCEFLQAFDVVLLGRGQDAATPALVMKKLADGFTAVPSTTVPGALSLPNFLRGLNASNRVFVISGRDNVIASDELDYVTYSLKQDFRINQGEADQAVALAMFGDSTLITLKETRVYKTTGVTGDLSGIATKLVTAKYGCVAPRTVVLGDDLYWLSQEGIASLTLTEFNEVQAQATSGTRNPGQELRMFSDDIAPLIERINWSYASNAVAIYHNKKIYFALPVDDAVTFGPELLGSGAAYDPNAGPGIVLRLEANKRYRWIPGGNELVVNADTSNGFVGLTGQTEFVAGPSSPVIAITTSSTTCLASLKRANRGVNNAVAVYNTVNKAWEGYDLTEGPEGREVKFFFTFPYNGKERLFFVGADGWINLFEETSEDALSNPYVDIEVMTLPAPGSQIQINGGTVAVAEDQQYNSFNSWGCDTLADARINLYWGFVTAWTRPNTQIAPIANGIRVFGTNGVVPTIFMSGANFATLTYRTRAGIETDFYTRGYGAGRPLETKQGRELAVFGESWAPELSISVVGEGVGNETTFVDAQTRDRTKFEFPWDAPRYDVSNPNDNYLQEGREDYSFAFATATSTIKLGSGVAFGQMQSLKSKVHAPARAVAPQVRVRNAAGRIKILAIGEKGFEVEKGRKGVTI